MDLLKNLLIAGTFFLSLFNFYLLFKFRKKDFQLAVLKEQMDAYRKLIANLFDLNMSINKAYDEVFPNDSNQDENNFENMLEKQDAVIVKFKDDYATTYNNFQSLIYILPDEVIESAFNYFHFVATVYEDPYDADVAANKLKNLNQKAFDVVNEIRNHMVIDDLTDATKHMLGKEPQLRFKDESEQEENKDEE